VSAFLSRLQVVLIPAPNVRIRKVPGNGHGHSAGRKHPDGDGFQQPAAFHVEKAHKHLEALTAADRGDYKKRVSHHRFSPIGQAAQRSPEWVSWIPVRRGCLKPRMDRATHRGKVSDPPLPTIQFFLVGQRLERP
jgi:hypothetical protein